MVEKITIEDKDDFRAIPKRKITEVGKQILTLKIEKMKLDREKALTKDGVSEFVCDGVIQMQLHDVSKTINRTVSVKKMRGTAITPGMNSLKFTKSGLEIEEYKAFY